jgi:uncharacterized damage-inducible protein DinB
MTVALMAVPAAAQQSTTTTAAPATIQTALANDVGTLSDKFTGLARAMTGKYDWRPGTGVRSVAEVFNLIVGENKMLTGVLTGAAASGGRGNPIADPAELQDALRGSYAALKQAVAGLSESDLKTPVKLFGRDMTKQGAALLLIFDQHEHLGQSIAYARSNGVVPPWSK